MRNVSIVLVAALSLGACTPRIKPAGYVSGAALTVTGVAELAAGAAMCSDNAFGCVVIGAPLGAAGVLMGAIGLGTLLVTALSPSSPKVPDVPAAGSSDAPDASPASPLEPAGSWPAPSPSRSPSAPSGSPLALSSSLSLRPAAGRSSLMSFH
jgi:hypothetical protein